MATSPFTPERTIAGVQNTPGISAVGPSRTVHHSRTPSSHQPVSRITSWSSRRGSYVDLPRYNGPRSASTSLFMSNRWKVAAAALAVLVLHMVSANIIIPMATYRLVDGTPSLPQSPANAGRTSIESGGIIRMLAETVGSGVIGAGDATLTGQQASLLAKYKHKLMRGRDVWIQRDALTNPLRQPPADAAAATDSDNVSKYTPRTLNALYFDKCNNDTLVPYESGSGREWVTTARSWARQHGDGVSRYRWCRGGSDTEVPDLKQVLMLRSNRTRHPRAITIVTQLSLERTAMLEQQCELWPFSISAVVYIPLLRGRIFSAEDDTWHMEPLETGIDDMRAFWERMQTSGKCALDFEVVAEERCTRELASMYPANAVRNRALMMARTDVVLLLDVDFVVDLSLQQIIEDDAQYGEMLGDLEQRKALVLPAFEAWDQTEWGRRLALDAVHQGKTFISHKFMYNIVIGFHMSHYPQGHEKTNFWRWINTTQPYQVEYQIGFEPYILMARKFVPYYDERFRGYYWNKVQHLMHISMQNEFTFVVHPRVFVVHIPHRKPATKWRTRRSGQKERNHVMFLEALEDMKKQRFVPVTAFPHLCLPPAMQRAAAEVVGNQEQKAKLIEMAGWVGPLTSGEPQPKSSPPPEQQPRGELPFAQERPVVAAAAAARKEAAQELDAQRAEELRRDLEDLQEMERLEEESSRVPSAVKQAQAEASDVAEMEEAQHMMQDLQNRSQGSGAAANTVGGASSSKAVGTKRASLKRVAARQGTTTARV